MFPSWFTLPLPPPLPFRDTQCDHWECQHYQNSRQWPSGPHLPPRFSLYPAELGTVLLTVQHSSAFPSCQWFQRVWRDCITSDRCHCYWRGSRHQPLRANYHLAAVWSQAWGRHMCECVCMLVSLLWHPRYFWGPMTSPVLEGFHCWNMKCVSCQIICNVT